MTLVVGGRGFIGSYLCRAWEAESFDLVDGQNAHDLAALVDAMGGHQTVVHLASNADIALGAEDPLVDFHEGTSLTANVCEAARRAGVRRILYASGSGVYGRPRDWLEPFRETDLLRPCSPYGASKAGGEALVEAYARMFGIWAASFRFANVVGPGMTHGVIFDFIRKLRQDPERLVILGDGGQSKNYVGVDDVVEALGRVMERRANYQYRAYNVAGAGVTNVMAIAKIVWSYLGLSPAVEFEASWPGDVERIQMSNLRLYASGWRPSRDSTEAVAWAVREMVEGEPDGAVRGHRLVRGDA